MSDNVTQASDRFVIHADGAEAGFTQFVDVDGDRVFFHTVIDEAFGGRGLAGKLVAQALTETRDAGLRIAAICPFVVGYIAKHPEWAEHSVEVTAAHKAAIPR